MFDEDCSSDDGGGALARTPPLAWSFTELQDKGFVDGDGNVVDEAFQGVGGLPDVITLPVGVKAIGDRAFEGCSSVTTLTIPKGVEAIGDYAFSRCSSVMSIVTCDGTTLMSEGKWVVRTTLVQQLCQAGIVGDKSGIFPVPVEWSFVELQEQCFVDGDGKVFANAFNGVEGLPDVIILPVGVKTIGHGAFYECSSVTTLSIPEGVKTIGNNAFRECSSVTTLTIPEGVKTIGDCAFSGCSSVTTLAIPEGVKTIGDYAFDDCSSATTLTIPEGIKTIGNNAFRECSSVTTLTIPEGVKSIGDHAFDECSSVTTLTIPEGVKSIGDYAFDECRSVMSIVTCDGNTLMSEGKWVVRTTLVQQLCQAGIVGDKSGIFPVPVEWSFVELQEQCFVDGDGKVFANAFNGVEGLPDVIIRPVGVKTIGAGAFFRCSSVTTLSIPEGVKTIGNKAFRECSSVTTLTIAEGVETIGDCAFSGCSRATTLTLPEGVKTIGNNAFRECSSVTSLTIAEGVETIGDYAFSGCSSVTTLTIPEGVKTIGDGAFYRCSSVTTLTIAKGVETIDEEAFFECSSIVTLTIPEGVKTIGDGAFYGCSNATTLTIAKGVETIAKEAFFGCSSVTSLAIPEGVKTIGDGAFCRCSSVTALTISEGVKTIGNNAFRECSSVTTLTIAEGVKTIGDYAFHRCSNVTTLSIPEGVKTIGNNAFRVCSSVTTLTIPEGVKTIGDCAFSGCSSVTTLTIPEGVKTIGDYAFDDCSSATTLTIAEGVKTIGDYAFCRCSSVTTLTIPEGVKTIGDYAFDDCSSATTLTIAEGVKSIGTRAFRGCRSVMSIVTCDGTTLMSEGTWVVRTTLVQQLCQAGIVGDKSGIFSVPVEWSFVELQEQFFVDGDGKVVDNAFNGVEGLPDVIILPVGVKTIGHDAFFRCSSVTTLTFPEGVKTIGDHAFEGCNSVTTLTISVGVKTIGKRAFYGCSSVTTLAIPEGVKTIGDYAFENCSSATTLTIAEGVKTIGDYAFSECSSVTTLTIPEGVKTIGESAFDGCSSVTTLTIAEGVETIGDEAFDECTSITTITTTTGTSLMEAGEWVSDDAFVARLQRAGIAVQVELVVPGVDASLQTKRTWLQQRLAQAIGPNPSADTRVHLRDVDRGNLLDGLCEQFGIDAGTGHAMAGVARPGQLDVSFAGESGFGDGVRREWFHLLVEELTDVRTGMFTSRDGGTTLQPSPVSMELAHFALLGRITGYALYHGENIPANWSAAFNKSIFGYPIVLEDLESVNPELYVAKVVYLRDAVYALEGQETPACTLEDLELDFEMAARSLDPELYPFLETGGARAEDTVIIQRTSSGNDALPVTEANKMEYLDAFVKHRLVDEIQLQIDAFRSGLGVVFEEAVLKELRQCCTPNDIQLLLCGVVEIDVADWEQSAEYKGGLTAASPLAAWFWNIVTQFDNDRRAQLLRFCTGSNRAPASGFNDLKGYVGEPHRFTLQSIPRDETYLPTAHTCFNTLDVPNYHSEAEFRDKLIMAITHSGGFDEGAVAYD